jgi:hypothetical protein
MAAVEQRGDLICGLDAAGLLRAQVREVHRELNAGLTEWLRAVAPAAPPVGSRVVALYLHAATVEDVTIHSLLRGVTPLHASDWAGQGPANYSTADLVPLRAYAQQVFAATDAYLARLGPDEASHPVDLTRLGQGRPTVAWVVSKFVVLQLAQIYGELTSVLDSRPRSGLRSLADSRPVYEPEHLAALGPDDRLDPGDLLPDLASMAKLFASITSDN